LQERLQAKVKVIANQKVGRNYFLLRLSSKEIASLAAPGQFVQIKVVPGNEIFLRRPLGVHRVSKNTFDCLYETVGKGTKLLSRRKTGDYLDVIGPLGNGFRYARRYDRHDARRILVAGGMGVAPLLFLAQKFPGDKPTVLIGARRKSQIICEREFKRFGCSVKVATDDGSKGSRGRVTDLLKKILHTTQDVGRTTIYACGPRPMLKEISRLSTRYNIPAEISLEEHLACGIGACFGCAVETRDGFRRICRDGPVFSADRIIWR